MTMQNLTRQVAPTQYQAAHCQTAHRQERQNAPLRSLTIISGHDKSGKAETFSPICMKPGELYTIVGNTGSGKSRFIKDIEQLADQDSMTGRRIFLNGKPVPRKERLALSSRLVAHLGQNMRFVLDTTVEAFLLLHARCRDNPISPDEVLAVANEITPEPVLPSQNLNMLSGGQARALMIADIALICDSPIVLIDEIENAGIDKEKAFGFLQSRDKLVLVVTHDPHTALMARKRIVMSGGAVKTVAKRTPKEEQLYKELSQEYERHQEYQNLLRKGEYLS